LTRFLLPPYSKLKACPYKHVPLICSAEVREGRKVPQDLDMSEPTTGRTKWEFDLLRYIAGMRHESPRPAALQTRSSAYAAWGRECKSARKRTLLHVWRKVDKRRQPHSYSSLIFLLGDRASFVVFFHQGGNGRIKRNT
jgi:hypothetical protein